MHTIYFTLSEIKKHSGKYIEDGTETAQWPNAMYFKKAWFPGGKLPNRVKITVEAEEK